jgi:hypothetical protein
MKHEAVLKWRDLESPGICELRAAVKRAAHAQEVKGCAHRVHDCWKFHSHGYKYASKGGFIIQIFWTNEQFMATNRHC